MSIIAAGAAAFWGITLEAERIQERIAHLMLGPITIGLCPVATLLFILNVTPPTDEVHSIRTAERLLVYADNTLTRWTDMPFAVFASIVVILAIASY